MDRLRLYKSKIFLLSLPLIHANTTPQTIYSVDAYILQKPCAKNCFIGYMGACGSDNVASAIGCSWNYCASAINDCYCRTDLQPIAEQYLTACVKSACTIGDSSLDISSAGSIYGYYCTSLGYTVAYTPATTTPNSGTTVTVAATPAQTKSSAACKSFR
jgi:hypothetical protein